MQTPTPGAQTPDTVESVVSASQAPQKVGTIPGLKNKIMTALAALSIMASAEKVEGALVIINGLPNSTIGGPVKISGLANESSPLLGNDNSYLLDASRRNSDVSNSRFTLNLSALDIGPSGGTLIITGTLSMSTSTNFNIVGNPGSGYSGLPYDLVQTMKWGNNINTLSLIGNKFEILGRPNDSTLGFTTAEAYSGTQAFSATIPISTAGTYYLDHEFMRSNTTGAGKISGFTLNYANIPEPSTTLLAGAGVGAVLLRRRRREEQQGK